MSNEGGFEVCKPFLERLICLDKWLGLAKVASALHLFISLIFIWMLTLIYLKKPNRQHSLQVDLMGA